MTKYKQIPIFKSVYLLITVLTVLVFLIETLMMFLLEDVFLVSKFWSFILDPLMLSILIFPFFYFLAYRPLNYKIIEQEKTNEALQKSLKELADYKYALDESSIIAISDYKGIINYVNDNFCKITKYSRSEIIGQDHRLLSSGYHSRDFFRNLWVTIESGKIWRGEIKNNAKDGTFFWLDTAIIPFLNDQGKSFQYLTIRTDITDRKKAEIALVKLNDELEQKVKKRTEALKKGELLYRSLFENMMEGFAYCKMVYEDGNPTDLIYLKINAAFENLTGLKNVVGKKMTEVIPGIKEDSPELFATYSRVALTGKSERFEFYIGTLDMWFYISAYSSQREYFIAIFDVITERKKAEKTLYISNERYNLVAKATNDAIWDWNLLTAEVVRAGKGLQILFGYDPDKASSDNFFWLKRVHPDDLQKMLDKREHIFEKSSAKYWEDEYRFKKADGQYAIVYDKGYIIRDKTGKPIRMIGATQDITKLRENEFRLNEMNDNLQKQAKDLAESNEELEQFAFVASHDLQEPLRMVTTFLTQLEKKYGSVIDDKGKKYIEFAVDGAKRMRQIILDLLEFSRVGRTDYIHEDFDLNELVKEIQILFRKKIEEKSAVIFTDELPVINAFKAPLRQVFQNLISNALKYAREDVPAQIHITVRELIDHWQFSIADNGIGIDKEYFDKIFVIFQRLHNKEKYSGTGIGLAVTKKVIEKQGGKIWVESEEEKGSTFYFTLPK